MGYESLINDFAGEFIGEKETAPKSIQDLIPLKDIHFGMYITNDDRYFKVVEVTATNFPLKEDREQEQIISTFMGWIKVAPAKCQLKISTNNAGTNEFVERLKKKRSKLTDPTIKALNESNIEFIERTSSKNNVKSKYYVVFEYEPGRKDAGKTKDKNYIAAQLSSTVKQAENYFSAMGNSFVRHADEDIFLGEFLYQHCNRHTMNDISYVERAKRIVSDIDIINKKNGKNVAVDTSMNNLVAPTGASIKTSPESFICDKTYYSYYYITGNGYPLQVESGWLASIFSNMPGVDIDIFFRREDKKDFLRKLTQILKFTKSKAMGRSEENMDYGDILTAYESQKYFQEALTAQSGAQDPYYLVTLFTVCADTYEGLEEKREKLEEIATNAGIKLADMRKFEWLGFKASLPFNNIPKKIYYKARRNVATEGVASIYPFTAYELNDPDGLYIGFNAMNRSSCTFNPYNKDKYANANILILGGSGMGKTYTLSLLAERSVLLDKQVFIITSEKAHEFRRLCSALGGTFVKFTGATKQNINIFDIRPDSKAKVELYGEDVASSLLAQKSQGILGWLELLFKDLTEEEKMSLDRAIKATYAKVGITDENSSIYVDNDETKPLKSMPILQDLVVTLEDMQKDNPESVTIRIINMLKNFCSGTYEGFNGHTNVDLTKKIIVFDLSDIQSTIESATVQHVLEFIWTRVKEDTTEEMTIVVEEGWKYISTGASEASAQLIQNIFKTIRGYGSNVILSTQEINDLMSSKYGESLISCSAHKFLLGVESGQSKVIGQALSLTEGEARHLEKFSKGTAYLIAGNDRLDVHIQASPLEHDIITTDSRDLARIRKEMNK